MLRLVIAGILSWRVLVSILWVAEAIVEKIKKEKKQ